VDLLKATADSINTAYVDLTMEIGADRVLDAAVAAGIPENTPGLRANARIPLGTNSARNIDMANAYATLAAQGVAAQWHTVNEVLGPNGGSRYKFKVKRSRVFEKDVMADVTYALERVVREGTGTGARRLGRPAAGKTGTAEDRSAWFVGFTPQLVAAVDFYKGDGTESLDGVGGLSTFFGGRYPTAVWTTFMQAALKGQRVRDFPEPAFVGRAVNPAPVAPPSPTSSSAPPSDTASPTPTPTAPPTPTEVPPTPDPGPATASAAPAGGNGNANGNGNGGGGNGGGGGGG
jgi:membrane peptidoglycan carboxypeptidase